MTEITHDGELALRKRETPTMGYPLPTEEVNRFTPKFNHYGQYLLPHPNTGRATSFARATTVASTITDYYALNLWKQRQKVAAVVGFLRGDNPEVSERLQNLGSSRSSVLDTLITVARGEPIDQTYNAIIDLIDSATGGNDAAELGTAVHAWLEAVDIGAIRPRDVPAMFQPHLVAYRDVLARHALVAVPEYVERLVLNDAGEETVVGTLDRIYRVQTTGQLVLGDLKTSKTLDFGWLEYAVQFAVYGYARLMLSLDGTAWEQMPKLDLDACYCVHVPSNQPERASCVTFDLEFGFDSMVAALDVRERRRHAKHKAPFVHAIPTPSDEALRYVQARHAVQDISEPADLAGLWDEFADVWSDELTQLGYQIAELF